MSSPTSARITARETMGSSSTSLSEITMISADRMKSVRMAPEMVFDSASGPCRAAGTSCSWSSLRNAWMTLWAPS